jgi:chromate reductase
MAAERLKVLAVCGSRRTGSYNQKLLDVSIKILTNLGVEVSTLSLVIDALPVFSPDIRLTEINASIVKNIQSQITASSGLLICSPQYNGSIPPFLKNIIDWTAPHAMQEEFTSVFDKKIVCLMGAARNAATSLGGLAHLSSVFGHLGAIVVPQYYCMSHVEKLISDSGGILDIKTSANLEKYLKTFYSLLNGLEE